MPFSFARDWISFQVELGGHLVVSSERSQPVPGRVLDLDAVAPALLFADMLDLAGIEYAGRAFRRRRRFQIAGELADFLLKVLQGTEGCDIEHRHEASVIVPAGWLHAKAQAREQAAQHLDHRSQSASLVALAAAERQQRADLAVLRRIGGVPSLGVDDPA